MERLEHLLADLEKINFTGKKSCLLELNEQLNNILYFLEVKGPEADKALMQIQACCWMVYEDRHTKTDEQFFLTFHYIKDKAFRACRSLLETKQRERSAA